MVETLSDVVGFDFGQLLVSDYFRIEKYNRFVGFVHGISILWQEVCIQAAECVKLHTGNQLFVRILFLHRLDCGFQLGR